MSKLTYVFYAGLLHTRYSSITELIMSRRTDPWPDEITQGCYIYHSTEGWLRGDFTPVLLEDVPKELRTAVLLLT